MRGEEKEGIQGNLMTKMEKKDKAEGPMMENKLGRDPGGWIKFTVPPGETRTLDSILFDLEHCSVTHLPMKVQHVIIF